MRQPRGRALLPGAATARRRQSNRSRRTRDTRESWWPSLRRPLVTTSERLRCRDRVARYGRSAKRDGSLSFMLAGDHSRAYWPVDYDAAQFKRGSEMPKRPDVGVIAEQLFERLKQIEDHVTHSRRLIDELGRLRDVVKDLEREIISRVSGQQVTAAE